MCRRLAVAALLACGAWLSAASEIVVVYPRSMSGQPVTYHPEVDSSFVLGHIAPPSGKLLVNGADVPYTDRGAFLAFLPLHKDSILAKWELVLLQDGTTTASWVQPYAFSAIDRSRATPGASSSFPRVVTVRTPNAHARTAPNGTYCLFPDVGAQLLATAADDGLYFVRCGTFWQGVIEQQCVDVEPDSVMAPVRVGNGECRSRNGITSCAFECERPVPWTSELSADARSLLITLYGAYSGVDRVQYGPRNLFLQEVICYQRGDDVVFEVRCAQRLDRGYGIEFAADSFRIDIRSPYQRRECRLKGKTIVVDAGHGGAADGAIGPLGTREKDVTLQWATLLSKELRRRGAVVELTRESDVDLGLYERIDRARSVNADFLVSLHCNALPDHENPWVRHGAGTYYYQSGSLPAARMIHRQVVRATGLRDDGLFDANLALVRPTSFPSVLVEGAYIIYPAEEELLHSVSFLRRLSRGIAEGLEEWFSSQRQSE